MKIKLIIGILIVVLVLAGSAALAWFVTLDESQEYVFGEIIEGDYRDPCRYDNWDTQVQHSEIAITQADRVQKLTREIHSDGRGQSYIDKRHQTFDSSGKMIAEIYDVQGIIYHRELLESGSWGDWVAVDGYDWDFYQVAYPLHPMMEPAEFMFPKAGQFDERSSFCGLISLHEPMYRGIEYIDGVETRHFTGTRHAKPHFEERKELYIDWEFWVDRSGDLRQSRTSRGLDIGDALVITKVSYPDDPIEILAPYDSGIPTLPGGDPNPLVEYSYVILLGLGALIPVGTVGFFCGLMFPNLRWWSWTLIGMLCGILSVAGSSMLLGFLFDGLNIGYDSEVLAAFVRFAVTVLGAFVIPGAVIVGLAWVWNSRRVGEL